MLEIENIKNEIKYIIENKDTIQMERYFNNFHIVLNDLKFYCQQNNYFIPEDNMCFLIRIFGTNHLTEKILFVFHALLIKDMTILKKLYENPLLEIKKVLEDLIQELDNLELKILKEKMKVKRY